MKIAISVDEYYPFREVDTDPGWGSTFFDVDCETVARWNRAMKRFHEVQEEMRLVRLREEKNEY